MPDEQTPPTPEWEDKTGASWRIELNYGVARALKRGPLKVDVIDVSGGAVFQRIATEDDLLLDLLWALSEEQAAERGLDEEAFFKRIDSAAIDAAAASLEDAIVGFTRQSRRGAVRAAVTKAREVQRRADDRATTLINSPEVEAEIESAMQTLEETAKREIGSKLDACARGGSGSSSPPSPPATGTGTPSGS